MAGIDPAVCGAAPTGRSENIVVELVSEHASVQPGRPFQVGLRMKLKRGWHTYWKQPGDAGMPLRIEWTLPSGFRPGPIEWPVPERIPTSGLMSYGYEGEVLMPVTITPPARILSDSVTIAAAFDWLECREDVCLAGSAQLDLRLPVLADAPRPGLDAPRFARSGEEMPRAPQGWTWSATAGPRAIELSFRPPENLRPTGGYLFIDQPLVAVHAAPQGFQRTGDGYRLTVVPAENAPEPPRRITGVLVLDGVPRERGAVAVNVDAVPGDPAPATPQKEPARDAWPLRIVLVALTGLVVGVLLRRLRGPKTLGEKS